MKYLKILILGLIVFSTSNTFAQENGSWWKKLFKKESVEQIEKDEDKIEEDDVDIREIEKDDSEIQPNDTIIVTEEFVPRKLAKTDTLGKIKVNNPFETDPIVEKFKDKDYRGYRIQIFLGELNTAKRTRATFMSKKSYDKCYIEQRAPDYVVLVGNYRDLYEAHQSLFKLKQEFPNAFIVDSEINL